EKAFDDDHFRNGQGYVDDHRPDDVGRDVAGDDAQVRDAGGVRGLDELLGADRKRLAAHDARHGEPLHGADADEDEHDAASEQDHQQDHEEEERKRVEDVDETHHHGIQPAAVETCDGTVGYADHEA